jgi:hypothetical protein
VIRARRVGLAGGVVVLGIVIYALLAGGGGSARLLAGGGGAGGNLDPLSFSPARSAALVAAAAAGEANVLDTKSPGGVVASAQRTERFAAAASVAAKAGPLDAATLESIVMLESAGRPDVIAGSDPSDAAGLTQILAGTATMLLGMRVDLPASRRLGDQIASAVAAGETARVERLEDDRARVDERFDPAAALAATERYAKIAEGVFGREDLAIESYHMGIGNLETALRLYAGSGQENVPIAKLVRDDDLSYARLYFDSTPIDHPAAYSWLAGLGDDSATYLWRVDAAGQALELYRGDRSRLAQLARLENAAPSAELALRPAGTAEFADSSALAAARVTGAVVGLPDGSSASSLGLRAAAGLVLRPQALAAALYIAAAVRAIAGASAPLQLTAATTDLADLGTVVRASDGLAEGDPLDASGYAFDIARSYASPAQAQAFQFILDRLQTLDLIAWTREARIIHIVVGPGASVLAGLLGKLEAGGG